jgi:hypothetical protein
VLRIIVRIHLSGKYVILAMEPRFRSIGFIAKVSCFPEGFILV